MEDPDCPHANLFFFISCGTSKKGNLPCSSASDFKLTSAKKFLRNFSDQHLASSLISKTDDLDDKKFKVTSKSKQAYGIPLTESFD